VPSQLIQDLLVLLLGPVEGPLEGGQLRAVLLPEGRQQLLNEFDMDWALTNFLRRQEYDATWETAVELAITLTGSNRNAQALTCMDYIGCVVVRLLQKALVSPALSCSGKQALRNYCQISHHSRFPCRWNGSRH
jgi:hypothetical protein